MANLGTYSPQAVPKAIRPLILIADDDRVLAQLLSSRLSKENFTVVVSYDAMHAFMSAMRLAPAVVRLDINMPGGTGLEVLKRLKTSTRTSLIPVIVLSGSLDPADVQNVSALSHEIQCVRDGRFGREVLSAVGKAVRRDVDDAHDQRPAVEAQNAVGKVPFQHGANLGSRSQALLGNAGREAPLRGSTADVVSHP